MIYNVTAPTNTYPTMGCVLSSSLKYESTPKSVENHQIAKHTHDVVYYKTLLDMEDLTSYDRRYIRAHRSVDRPLTRVNSAQFNINR